MMPFGVSTLAGSLVSSLFCSHWISHIVEIFMGEDSDILRPSTTESKLPDLQTLTIFLFLICFYIVT